LLKEALATLAPVAKKPRMRSAKVKAASKEAEGTSPTLLAEPKV
jgi:hypothetical protein